MPYEAIVTSLIAIFGGLYAISKFYSNLSSRLLDMENKIGNNESNIDRKAKELNSTYSIEKNKLHERCDRIRQDLKGEIAERKDLSKKVDNLVTKDEFKEHAEDVKRLITKDEFRSELDKIELKLENSLRESISKIVEHKFKDNSACMLRLVEIIDSLKKDLNKNNI